jgi:hypothetical protein
LNIKLIQLSCPLLWDVLITKLFSDDRRIFTFCQRVIITMSGTGFGELNKQLTEQFSDSGIDIFRAIVLVKAFNGKGK